MKFTHGMNVFLVMLWSLCLATPSQAAVLYGQGWGKTLTEAKKAALGDLSAAIQVQVQSRFTAIESEIDGKTFSDVKSVLTVTSDLPILGADSKETKAGDEFQVTVTLDPSKAGRLYQARLQENKKDIENALAAAKKAASNAEKHRILVSALCLYEQYARLKFVAKCLGSYPVPELPITRNDLHHRILALEKEADSIDFAAKLITKGFDPALAGIYVYPPVMRDSHEVTQFAALMRDSIAKRLNNVDSPNRAGYLMTGRYQKSTQGIDLFYILHKIQGNEIKSALVHLTPDAYFNYETEPKTISLDKLLHQGFAVSSDFRVSLATNLGSENLLFLGGQEIEILVKSNLPAYFYLAGHIDKADRKQYSYLLDLQEAKGLRRFVAFINADDVNKWISLGKFEVTSPFGVENLQMIAATKDLAENLPPVSYDPATRLYLIARNPKEGVAKARAFKRKQAENSITAEAVLTITTMANEE